MYRPGSFIYPAIFRLRPPVRYIHEPNDINEQVHYLLIRVKYLRDENVQDKIVSRIPSVIYEDTDAVSNAYQLLYMK
jgi:hypothetical protein